MTTVSTATAESDLASGTAERYRQVRDQSERLCRPLAIEDYVVQSMPDASPAKWHLAHTSWFFETFLLQNEPGYQQFSERFAYLFNSYYVTLGERHCRPRRGLLSRPTVAEVYEYREHVDAAMLRLLKEASRERLAELLPVIEVGLNHEQQHQELLLTDLKHLFASNPLRPAYREDLALSRDNKAADARWMEFDGGIHAIGHASDAFAYDNESPRHKVFLEPFALASRLVTSGEYLAFVEDGGYQRADLWLSEGWNLVQTQLWQAPLYWEKHDGDWRQMTLAGMQPIAPAEPVSHVSYFEADAFARWAGHRLPTEAEWEVAAAGLDHSNIARGNFVEREILHPLPAAEGEGLQQMYGDLWEWTASAYLPYPGYAPPAGALGEYNGKFMCNQFVLRGGSCGTPASHVRATYRNFFPPDARWQFMGLRLARKL